MIDRDPKEDPKEGDIVILDNIKWIFSNSDWRILLDEGDSPLYRQGWHFEDRACKECNGKKIRKTQTGFSKLIDIWWCDDCKDEA